MEFKEIKRIAHGRWPDILSGMGINVVLNRHRPCPGCGGRDRFRFDNRTGNGDFICSQMDGGISGDGFNLLQHVFGCSARMSFEAVAGHLGLEDNKPIPPLPRPSTVVSLKPKSDYALELWSRAGKGVASHPYALNKGIDFEAGARRGRASGSVIGQNSDCLVIPIRNPENFEVVAVHCINAKGKKQTFGPLKGNGFICGNTKDRNIPWFIVEGWADAISIVFHHHEGNAVGAAPIGAYGMQTVLADRINEVFNPNQIIIIRDKEVACG